MYGWSDLLHNLIIEDMRYVEDMRTPTAVLYKPQDQNSNRKQVRVSEEIAIIMQAFFKGDKHENIKLVKAK